MKKTNRARRLVTSVALATTLGLLLFAGPAPAKGKHEVIERFRATAMNLAGGRATILEIGIFSWDTDEDRESMILAFDNDGNDGLYKWLTKQKEKAFVKAPNTLGYQMRYAYQAEVDGKRLIVLGTDRPIAMGEVMRDSWTQDNNISIVTMTIDPETGEGTGTMIFGAEFGVDKKTGKISIESVTTNPTQLTKVEIMKEKKKK